MRKLVNLIFVPIVALLKLFWEDKTPGDSGPGRNLAAVISPKKP
jgi:hypothetical protein